MFKVKRVITYCITISQYQEKLRWPNKKLKTQDVYQLIHTVSGKRTTSPFILHQENTITRS